MIGVIGCWIVLLHIAIGPMPVHAENQGQESDSRFGAVVLAYSRFGDNDDGSATLDAARFSRQIAILKQGDYRVIPLTELAHHLRNGQNFDDKSIAITLDNAYASIRDFAIPQLRAAKLPFTLFIATDLIDGGGDDYLTWDELRDLARDPTITFGLRGAAHLHLAETSPQNLIEDVRRARRRLKEQLGLETSLFSYPYGEYNETIISLLRDQGIETAFGSHSGVVSLTHDPMGLPRFPITAEFGDEDRFRLSINALPLPIYDPEPADTMLARNPPGEMAFSVEENIGDLRALRCFASDQGQVPTTITPQRRVTIRIGYAFAPGRARVNCTMPGPDDDDGTPRWRWYGRQFTVRDE